MPLGSRPEDKITTEEIRLLIASVAGPMRLAYGSHREILLPTGQPIEVAKNSSAPALFVDVRAVPDVAVGTVIFNKSESGDARTAITHDISVAPFQQVLLPTERLFAFALIPANGQRVIVTDIQP